MRNAKTLNITERVKEFVIELDGRYHQWISDELLTHWLAYNIQEEYDRIHSKGGNIIMQNIAYHSCCYIFETLLEYRCNTGGNGHHVAQNLAKKFA